MEEMMNVNLKEKREEIKSGQAEMRSIVNVWIVDMKDDRRETVSWQVMMEACLDSKELNPEDTESEVEHREVPKEGAIAKPVRGPVDLAVVRTMIGFKSKF
jgi:hypothetical protein